MADNTEAPLGGSVETHSRDSSDPQADSANIANGLAKVKTDATQPPRENHCLQLLAEAEAEREKKILESVAKASDLIAADRRLDQRYGPITYDGYSLDPQMDDGINHGGGYLERGNIINFDTEYKRRAFEENVRARIDKKKYEIVSKRFDDPIYTYLTDERKKNVLRYCQVILTSYEEVIDELKVSREDFINKEKEVDSVFFGSDFNFKIPNHTDLNVQYDERVIVLLKSAADLQAQMNSISDQFTVPSAYMSAFERDDRGLLEDILLGIHPVTSIADGASGAYTYLEAGRPTDAIIAGLSAIPVAGKGGTIAKKVASRFFSKAAIKATVADVRASFKKMLNGGSLRALPKEVIEKAIRECICRS